MKYLDFYNAARRAENLVGMQSLSQAKKIAERNPQTYTVKRGIGCTIVTRETANSIRTAVYGDYKRGVSIIKHKDKSTGKVRAINTCGDYIENYDFFKRNKIRHFSNISELLKYRRKKEDGSFNLLNWITKPFRV